MIPVLPTFDPVHGVRSHRPHYDLAVAAVGHQRVGHPLAVVGENGPVDLAELHEVLEGQRAVTGVEDTGPCEDRDQNGHDG